MQKFLSATFLLIFAYVVPAQPNRFTNRGCYLYSTTFNQYAVKYDSLMLRLQEMEIRSIILSVNTGVLGDNGPTYTSRVKEFNRQAHLNDITVHAMHLQGYTYIDDYQSAVIATDKIIAYNNSAESLEKFDGLHLDVEPHTHLNWNSENGYLPESTVNEDIMQRFLGLLATLRDQLNDAILISSDALIFSADQTYWIHEKIESGSLNTGHINQLLEWEGYAPAVGFKFVCGLGCVANLM